MLFPHHTYVTPQGVPFGNTLWGRSRAPAMFPGCSYQAHSQLAVRRYTILADGVGPEPEPRCKPALLAPKGPKGRLISLRSAGKSTGQMVQNRLCGQRLSTVAKTID